MRLPVTLSLVILVYISSAQCPTGLKVDNQSYYDTPVLTATATDNLPEVASLKRFCPKPGNQLNHLTSAGWATAYYATTILHARQSGQIDINTISREAFSPTYTHYAIQGENADCSIPVSIKESLDVLVNEGVPFFTEYPYFCPDTPPGRVNLSTISGYSKVFNSYDPPEVKIIKIKTALSQGLPVVIALQTSSSFCEPGELWSPSTPIGTSGHHAICIIGYDDNKYDGSFELINSYGKNWGSNGFIHVPYNKLLDRISEAFAAFLFPDEQEFKMKVNISSNYGSKMPVRSDKRCSYAFTKGYGNGHQFKFDIQTDFHGYLYLYYFNDRGENGLLFPGNEHSSGELPFDVTAIHLPGKNRYIQLDNHPGEETMVIVLSINSLTIDQIKQTIEDAPNESLRCDPENLQVMGKINRTNTNAIIQIGLDHI
tara:strand:+ start:39645 stop:40928 length:1284 start_codon:yes stop_codon:yes gene_type:complete